MCSLRHRAWTAALTLLLALAALSAARAQESTVPTGFINHTVQVGATSYPYVVYVPRDFSPAKKWPVIVFLHGSGERGTDGLKQTQVGIGPHIRLHAERFPCLVVFPQVPPDRRFADEPAEAVLKQLDAVLARYNGDPDRVVLTGLSMGGSGTWTLGTAHPERFAALAPVCGGAMTEAAVAKLKGMPVWAHCGDMDRAQLVQNMRQTTEALKAAGNPNVKYTEYPGVGHNSWDATYSNPEVIAWMLERRRGAP
jgi:predicted peptidase